MAAAAASSLLAPAGSCYSPGCRSCSAPGGGRLLPAPRRRPTTAVALHAWAVPRQSRLEWGRVETQLAAVRTSCRATLQWLSSTARFHRNVGYEWPLVFPGLIKPGLGRCLFAAGMVSNTGGQVGDDSDDGINVTNKKLRAVIRKSKEVLEIHRNLLEKISTSERRKITSIIEDSSIYNEQDPFGQSDSSFSRLDEVPDDDEFGYDLQMYLDRHPDQSEVVATQDYAAQLSQISEMGQSVAEGTSDDPSASAIVDLMNIILVAAECAPWSKTGGLGDVAGALPKALARRGHRVMVVVPMYKNYAEPQQLGEPRRYQVAGQDMEVIYYHAYIDGVDFVFIDNPIFHHVENDIYGGNRTDILKRMVLLCKAAIEVPWYVPCGGYCYGDGNLVFIANDWHTALLPVYLKAYYRDNGFMIYARSVLVIHNIAHQGRGPLDDFSYLDLPAHYMDLFKLYDPFGVGGLRDTVEHYNPYEESGLGWTFEKAEANRMIDALGHCLNTFRNYRSSWEGLQKRGMMQDLSWDNAAKLYEEVLLAAKYQW
ncbi:hypothetical protein E2562_024425 [Oryza meyeriana var. granulata]|uniref:starch synthase n=2 Tax=Oryza meyeriana var. granulata TaxID=110450 RepID=A0A6G1EYL9_9ORYZ|nr:hypothetical protein E2562_024425 [Oryza meyeriana var. granulata]